MFQLETERTACFYQQGLEQWAFTSAVGTGCKGLLHICPWKRIDKLKEQQLIII